MSFRSVRASDVRSEPPVLSRFIPHIVVALGLMCGTASGQGAGDIRTYHTITDPRTASALVARVGTLAITAREFLLSYEFGPAFVKRSADSKKRYLEFMTNEKLLALEGYARGLDHSASARKSLSQVEADLATEELYRDDVLKGVRVSGAEIEQGARQQLVSLSLRWLYAPDRARIADLRALIASGVPFDSLFRSQNRDSAAGEERAMETTRFKLRRANPIVARMVDTLRAGIPSSPVRGPDGYYILQLTDLQMTAMPTETELNKLRYDAGRAITEEKADSLSDLYVQRMMLARNPVIIRSSLNSLGGLLGRQVLKESLYNEWDLSRFAREGAQLERDTLVTLKNGSFLGRDFLDWYHARETLLKFSLRSPDAFYASLEQLVWRMVRDRLLTRRAIARGLQKRASVATQVTWWEQKVLYEMVKDSLARSIHIDSSAAGDFYRENRRRYLAHAGDTLSYDRARDQVLKELFDTEFAKRLLHMVLALKQKYPVTVEQAVLSGLPVDTENDPKAIDVYTVKKGGIFPRPAFPVIDYAWQTWQ